MARPVCRGRWPCVKTLCDSQFQRGTGRPRHARPLVEQEGWSGDRVRGRRGQEPMLRAWARPGGQRVGLAALCQQSLGLGCLCCLAPCPRLLGYVMVVQRGRAPGGRGWSGVWVPGLQGQVHSRRVLCCPWGWALGEAVSGVGKALMSEPQKCVANTSLHTLHSLGSPSLMALLSPQPNRDLAPLQPSSPSFSLCPPAPRYSCSSEFSLRQPSP